MIIEGFDEYICNNKLLLRDLLLLVGWIIGVADIFERYEEVCVHEALREVENMVRNQIHLKLF